MRSIAVLLVSAATLVDATGAAAGTITRHARTPSYSLTLVVGPKEAMYTPAQVRKLHPTKGEMMVGGGATAGSMHGMGASTERHLELAIHSRRTGAVVADVRPRITVTAAHAMEAGDAIDAVAMRGVGEGRSDLHYGNNVSLVSGQLYRVDVAVRGQRATFIFRT